jgi:hypothetical protein
MRLYTYLCVHYVKCLKPSSHVSSTACEHGGNHILSRVQLNTTHHTMQRTTLASSASTNPKSQSARSDSNTGGGGGGGGGRGSSKGGGKGSDNIIPKPLTPAVGAPVDADLQVNSNTLFLLN